MKHKTLRKLCNFQYWLGSNYNTLPTNSVEMTKRAIKYIHNKDDKSPVQITGNPMCDNTCPYWGYQCNINEMQKECTKIRL